MNCKIQNVNKNKVFRKKVINYVVNFLLLHFITVKIRRNLVITICIMTFLL